MQYGLFDVKFYIFFSTFTASRYITCVHERPVENERKIAPATEFSRGATASLSKTDCIQFCCCGFEKSEQKT